MEALQTKPQDTEPLKRLETSVAFETMLRIRDRMERAAAQMKWITRVDVESGEEIKRFTLQSPDSELNETFWDAEERLDTLLAGFGSTAVQATES